MMYQKIMGKENLISTLKIMDRLISNIIKDPTNPKFKSLNLENKKIKATIGSTQHGIDIFKSLRFVPTGTSGELQLEGTNVENIQDFKMCLDTIHGFGSVVGKPLNPYY